MTQLRHGHAYWIANCPPLDGSVSKRRPAVFLDLGDVVPPREDDLLVLVAATTDDELDSVVDEDAIWVEIGLPRPCWVIPRWVIEVPLTMIDGDAGRLYQPQLDQLTEAVVDRFYDLREDAE